MRHHLIYSGYHLWFLYDYLVNRKGRGVDVGKPPNVFPGISSKLVLDVSRNIFADKTIHCFKLFCTQCKIWRMFMMYAYIVYPLIAIPKNMTENDSMVLVFILFTRNLHDNDNDLCNILLMLLMNHIINHKSNHAHAHHNIPHYEIWMTVIVIKSS